ncbi:hypothetical protein HY642_02780 [Candidatus Woesearchaeota archaeon]|nr:hypothetical protein [Candidatus Woesearchaeota archaeon]
MMHSDQVYNALRWTAKHPVKIVAAGALLFGAISSIPHWFRHDYKARMIEWRVKKQGDRKDVAYMRLMNGEVRAFENTDSMLEGKVDTEEIYTELVPGHTYELKTYGISNVWLRTYENIVSAKEAKE